MLSLKKNRMPILPLLMVEHLIGLALNLHDLQSSIALRVSRAGIVLLSGYIQNFNTVPGARSGLFFFYFLFFLFWVSTQSYWLQEL